MSMDALEALVEGPRARGAFVLRLELDSDWSIRVADESLLTVMPVQAGSCTVTTEWAAAHASAGDVVVVRGPGAYSVASDPDRPPDFIIEPNQVCIDVDGNRLVESMRRGIRTWGTTAEGVDRILVGTYARPLEVGRLLVELLPRNAEVTQARDRIQSVESGAARGGTL
ncbi:cupin domain-containing protein [Arthrobacter jiangjiafuii]|uniref:Cupin domain-containing protein n=1 Tax=Arthrobacter jiangjiafuii TaxID=2817475 RepID=A0A975M7R9_9MICC|nr:cupin domain-containing protein [Arthrobacter jiangjiafuii]MBP3042927.1 cupin domain-containing protein [Arthrobacter jiangjiafuii]QWC11457.1 cupin domain-containing protein [Arthrobacter jiangjiafuii]